ncbi:MAG: flagellar hook-length control protein FliK [Methylococcales bacterium]|nr:flagellar hook-length control protein FliK [Methylococcales bacterium]
MDIQTTFNTQILQTMKTLVESNLNLSVGQKLVTSVAAINETGITLKWGVQILTVENKNSRAIFVPHRGQNVTLQVVETTPELEFKIVTFDTQFHESLPSAEKLDSIRLSIATAPLVNRIDESLKNLVSNTQKQQPVEAKVVGLVGQKIQLELIIDDHKSGAAGKKILISVERNQLHLLASQNNVPLKVGQILTLAITEIGAMPEFTQLSSIAQTPAQVHEEQMAVIMKQLLPRHESPAVLLNQLRTDLPQLEIKNDSLAAMLKQNAAALFEHLQPKEQLFNPQKLKHIIYSSGLFFEAKNAASTVPKSPAFSTQNIELTASKAIDLKMPLLNLLQHGSITNILKQMISTLLQNLLKHESAPNPELAQMIEQNETQLHSQLLQFLRTENIPQSLKILVADILPGLHVCDDEVALKLPSSTFVDGSENIDFKSDLFKLMDTLKRGISQQNELALTEKQVDSLQQLQNKTENALAKVVIDQLHSLPKEDGGKQVWAFELPFLMGNQAETLKMEIQRDQISQNVDSQMQHWSVNLTLNPPKLGEVQCVISYQNGVINTYFKNQQPQTTVLINENLGNLKQQFQQAGLFTGLMSAHNDFQPIKSAYSDDVKSFLNERV